jgi:hypothetical protein
MELVWILRVVALSFWLRYILKLSRLRKCANYSTLFASSSLMVLSVAFFVLDLNHLINLTLIEERILKNIAFICLAISSTISLDCWRCHNGPGG